MIEKLAEYRKRYFGNYHDRTVLASGGSFFVNAAIGIGKLVIGLFLHSNWFISTAVYYLLLCMARGQALHQFRKTRKLDDPYQKYDAQFAVFRRGGIFVCMTGLSYMGVCIYMYHHGGGGLYPYYLQYGVAAVAFYKIGMAIYGIVVTHRLKNPVLSTLKIVGFVDAFVSIVAVQYALLAMESPASASTSSALFGMGCSIVFVGIGVYMLLKKKRVPEPEEFGKKDPIHKQAAPGESKRKKLESMAAELPEALLENLSSVPIWRCVIAITVQNGRLHLAGKLESDAEIHLEKRIEQILALRGLAGVPYLCTVKVEHEKETGRLIDHEQTDGDTEEN